MKKRENNLASEIISRISKKEPGLLYYSPCEIQKALDAKRAVVLENKGRLVGFGFWTPYGSFAEIHTLYICPEFRGRGFIDKILGELAKSVEAAGISKMFFFTVHPAIRHVAKKFGARKCSFLSLPVTTQLRVIRHRFNIRRWPNYFKYFKSGFKLFSMFVLERDAE